MIDNRRPPRDSPARQRQVLPTTFLVKFTIAVLVAAVTLARLAAPLVTETQPPGNYKAAVRPWF